LKLKKTLFLSNLLLKKGAFETYFYNWSALRTFGVAIRTKVAFLKYRYLINTIIRKSE